MAPTHYTYEEKIKKAQGRTFTMEQARQFERYMLKSPTGITNSYHWIDAKTKKPIAFIY